MTDTPEAPSAQPRQGPAWEWALVEVFGHRSHAGRCREEDRFGTKMLRVDVPKIVEPAAPLEVRGDATSAGIAPAEPTIEWTTHYYGGSAIFSYTLTDEASVMRANAPYVSPYRARLPAPEPDGHEFDLDVDGRDE